MENSTYFLAYLVVSITVCFSSIIIALFRRQNHMAFFSLSYACFAISAILSSMQTPGNLVASVVAADLISLTAVLFLFTAIRSYFESKDLFPKRFLLYFVIMLVNLLFTAIIRYNLVLRSVCGSLLLTVVFIDFLQFLWGQPQRMPLIVRSMLITSVIVNALSYILRAILFFYWVPATYFIITSGNINTYLFISYTVTSFLWFASIILIDDSNIWELLQTEEGKYRLLAETISDVIWVFDIKSKMLTYISPSVTNMTGFSPEEVLTPAFFDTIAPDYSAKLKNLIEKTVNEFLQGRPPRQAYYIEILQSRKDGNLIWVDFSLNYRFSKNGDPEVVGISRDVTERKAKEKEIEYLNLHDPSTGLWNKNALGALSTAHAAVPGHHTDGAAIFVDIDDFRIVNDSLGHAAGDRLIFEIAAKLKASVSNRGILFRYSGDEFIIIVESVDDAYVRTVATEIQQAVCTRLMLYDHVFYLTASIGYCIGNIEEGIEKTVNNADTALYVAKRTKNSVIAYSPMMEKTKTREALIEQDLQSALAKNEFRLFYQPIVDAKSGEVYSAEALLRWEHPNFGIISPADFIPIAEKTRLIIPITEWVITKVCSEIVNLKSTGIDNIIIDINLSPTYIESRGGQSKEFIIAALSNAGLEPSGIKMEITEATFMKNYEEAIRICSDLKALGIKLSLDDFGTGYSSFGYIKDIPLNYIKLDRSFIGLIDSDIKEQTIVRGMIAIAHGLGLMVVAEGVETERQLEMLREYDCDYIQGYYFSRPVPPDDFVRYYHSQDSLRKLSQRKDA